MGTMKTYKSLLGIALALVVVMASTIPFAVEDVSGATVSGEGASRKCWLYNTTSAKSLKVIVNYSSYIGIDRDYYNVTVKWIPLSATQPDETFKLYVNIQEVNKSVSKAIDFDGTNTDSLISFDTDLFTEQDKAYYNITLLNFSEASGDHYAGTTEITAQSMTGMIMWIMPVMITLCLLAVILGMLGTMKFDFGTK